MTTKGDKINEFMAKAHATGRTVYFATALRVIKVAPKHASFTRVRNGHFEVQQGKQGWVSVNYTNITAR